MNNIKNGYESFKSLMQKRLAGAVPDALLKAVISEMDDYGKLLADEIDALEKETADHRSEAQILRGLIGVQDPEIRAKIISLSEKVKFLEDQLLEMKKERDSAKEGLIKAEAGLELAEKEISKGRALREEEQGRYHAELERLRKTMKEFEGKVEDKRSEIDREKAAVSEECSLKIKDAFARTENELRTVSDKFRDSCNYINEAVQQCISGMPQPEQDLDGSVVQTPPSEMPRYMDAVLKASEEALEMFQNYSRLFAPIQPSWAPVNWTRFWQDMGRKFTSLSTGAGITAVWPDDKTIPRFITDEKLLFEGCSALVSNAVESMSGQGKFTVLCAADSSSLQIRFIDEGHGVAAENRGKLFTPFFTTRQGKTGLGLAKARRLARVLGGDVVYEPAVKGSVFIFSATGQRAG